MEVILLERVAKLGQMGEVVRVKDGFARNFLLPQGKALRATEANRSKFEGMKVAHILIGKAALSLGDSSGARASFTKAHQLAIEQHHEGPQAEMESMLADLE